MSAPKQCASTQVRWCSEINLGNAAEAAGSKATGAKMGCSVRPKAPGCARRHSSNTSVAMLNGKVKGGTCVV